MAGKVPSIQGRNYQNRRDLQMATTRQPPSTPAPQPPTRRAAGMPPGAAPLGLQPTPPAATVPAPAAPTVPQPDYTMESVPNVTDPSKRPDEHVLTGASYGFQPDSAGDPLALRLRSAYLADPDPALAELITGLDAQADRQMGAVIDNGGVVGGPRFHGVI